MQSVLHQVDKDECNEVGHAVGQRHLRLAPHGEGHAGFARERLDARGDDLGEFGECEFILRAAFLLAQDVDDFIASLPTFGGREVEQ